MNTYEFSRANGIVGPVDGQVGQFEVAVLDVPFDSGTTYRPGARFGPEAIRAGSRLLRSYQPYMDSEPLHDQQVVSNGLPIVDVVEVSPDYDHAEITSLAAADLAYDVISLMAAADS
jgi:agmatinase